MKSRSASKPHKTITRRHKACSIQGAMKKALKKYVLTFPAFAITLAVLGAGFTHFGLNKMSGFRFLSGVPKEFELTLNNIKLDASSKVSNKENVFLRLHFDENNALEIGRGQGWKLTQGQQIVVDQKIPVESRFINGDETKFVLEIVSEQNIWGVTKADIAVVRCNTLAKEISAYNRSFQCFIPGEKTAVLTYRLAEKGVPPPSAGTESKVAGF